MHSWFTALLFGFFAIPLHAAGLPLDEAGNVASPHTVLKITRPQSEEIEILGTLTLDQDQWSTMRKVAPACPKRIAMVLPVTYNDCSCGITGAYAIQLSHDTVAVMHDGIAIGATAWLAHEIGVAEHAVVFHADRRGQFHYNGTLIPFAVLLEVMAGSNARVTNETGAMDRYLQIQYPLGLDRSSGVLKERLDQLFALSKSRGWSIPEEPDAD